MSRGRPPKLDRDFRRSDEIRIAAAVELHRRCFKPLADEGHPRKIGAARAVSSELGGLLGAESVRKIYLRLLANVRRLDVRTLLALRRGLRRYAPDEKSPKILTRRALYFDHSYMAKLEQSYRPFEGTFVTVDDRPFENPRHLNWYKHQREIVPYFVGSK